MYRPCEGERFTYSGHGAQVQKSHFLRLHGDGARAFAKSCVSPRFHGDGAAAISKGCFEKVGFLLVSRAVAI